MIGFDPALIWFVVGMALVLLEFVAPGVILVFFGLGAWVVVAAVKLGLAETLAAQMAWFAVSSTVLLFGLRRFFKSWFMGFSTSRSTVTDLDEFTGQEVVVTSGFRGRERGLVEFKGVNWSARAVDQEGDFAVGERVRITAVDGLCLLVGKA
jgi:inner membrane protein